MKKFISNLKEKLIKITQAKAFKISLISLGIFIIISLLSLTIYSYIYSGKIYPNVQIGAIKFGGLTKNEAKNKLASNIDEIKNNDITFTYNDKNWKVPLTELQINYDKDKTIESLYSIGRRGGFFEKMKERITSIFSKKKLLAVYSFNKIAEDNILLKIKSDINIPEKNATFTYNNNKLEIQADSPGKSIDEENFDTNFLQEIGYLGNREI